MSLQYDKLVVETNFVSPRCLERFTFPVFRPTLLVQPLSNQLLIAEQFRIAVPSEATIQLPDSHADDNQQDHRIESTRFMLFDVPDSSYSSLSSSTEVKIEVHELPFRVRSAVWLPTSLPSLPLSSSSSSSSDWALAVTTSQGDVLLVGDPKARARLGMAHLRGVPIGAQRESGGRGGLFDDIFGPQQRQFDTTVSEAGGTTVTLRNLDTGKGKGKSMGNSADILDAPAHLLPPVSVLWRALLAVGLEDPDREEEASALNGMTGEMEGTMEVDERPAGKEEESKKKRASRATGAQIVLPDGDVMRDIFRERLRTTG